MSGRCSSLTIFPNWNRRPSNSSMVACAHTSMPFSKLIGSGSGSGSGARFPCRQPTTTVTAHYHCPLPLPATTATAIVTADVSLSLPLRGSSARQLEDKKTARGPRRTRAPWLFKKHPAVWNKACFNDIIKLAVLPNETILQCLFYFEKSW